VKALVDATPISGPAWVWRTSWLSRAMVAPRTLQTESTRAPRSRPSRSAARVSAVSPDWETGTSSERFDRIGWRYRNSLARSTSAGMPASCSTMYLATMQAW
jgi:hypothetical protein